MSWKLDDILLSSYGVGVRKTSGVLDMPKLVDQPNDWLDADGVDYWQSAADVKYADRELVLYCWIATHAGYADFKSKVAAFYAAITAAGSRTLKYNDTAIASVIVEKEIELPRKTAYLSSLQIGVFTLRLTVQGDPDVMSVTIKRWTGSETINVGVVLTGNLKVNKTLQGDIYADCTFETNTKLPLKYFDYIEVNSNGTNNDLFHLPADPHFEKKSTNKYVYSLRFEHQSRWLGNSQFLNDRGEGDFEYYANFDEIIDLIVINHNRSWWNNFHKGTVSATERRNHKFTGESCLEVLRRLCEEYELEYDFEYVGPSNYAINIQEQVANDKITTLEYGKGKGLYELSREEPNIGELCTKLFAFGSTRNVPAGYRSGMLRLSFTNNPLTNNADLHTGAGPHEKTVFFDEIYPRRTGTVTAYTQILPEDLTDAQEEVYPDGLYKITDSTIDFDINQYLSNGLTAKIRMNTGDNAGLEFEIYRYDNDTKEIFIIPNKDIRGTLFPNATLHPNINDTYVLVDIEMPASYITAAETELEAAAQDYINEFSIVKYPYRCVTDPAFLAANPDGYEIGDRIPLIDADYGINGMFRISELEYDAHKKTYDFVLSDLARLTRRQQTENRLKSLERAIEDTKKDTVESMRKEKETTQELKNRLIDPNDDKFAADRVVRNNSIDPGMLALDSIAPMWYPNFFIEPNFDGDEDKIRVYAGTLVVTNYNTLDRYNIAKDRANYNPTRSWTVAQTDITLPTKDAYYLWAKIDLTDGSTACVIEAHTQHIEMKRYIENNFLMIRMNPISVGEEAL